MLKVLQIRLEAKAFILNFLYTLIAVHQYLLITIQRKKAAAEENRSLSRHR